MDGQEIGGEIQLFHHGQFLGHQRARTVRCAVRIAPRQPFLRQPFQPGEGGLGRAFLMRVFIGQFAQIKAASVSDFQRAADRAGVVAKQADHVGGGFDAAFGIGQGAGADLVDGDMFAHTGLHICQLPAAGVVHQHIPHGHHRGRGAVREIGTGRQIGLVASVITRRCPQENVIGKAAAHLLDLGHGLPEPLLRQGDQDHALARLQHVLGVKDALAFLGPPFTQSQQTSQALIGGAVAGQGDPVHRAVLQDQTASGNQLGKLDGIWLGYRCLLSHGLPR